MKALGSLATVLLGFVLVGAPGQVQAAKAANAGWIDLFDPQLSKWEIWMGVPHETVEGLPPGTPTSADIRTGTPLGLGNDPKQVFTMTEQQGEPVLYVTGEIYAGLTTLDEFENYHIRLESKWGEKVWEPRLTRPRDSGLLIHCTGPHGAFWNVWMACVEYQIQENDFGDLYLLAGTSARVSSAKKGDLWTFNPEAPVEAFGDRPGNNGLVVRRSINHERRGDWNVVEVYSVGDSAIFLVNGRVVNAISEIQIKRGEELHKLSRGKLQLQSEGAEVSFRRMQIRSITAYPADVLRQAGWSR